MDFDPDFLDPDIGNDEQQFKCPQCKKIVTEKENTCPHCGYKISQIELIQGLKDQNKIMNKSMIFGVVVFSIFFMTVYLVYGKNV